MLIALPDLSKIAIVCANCAAMIATLMLYAVSWVGRCFAFGYLVEVCRFAERRDAGYMEV